MIAFGGNNTSGPIKQAAALNANRGCHNPGDFEAGTLLVQGVAHTLRGEGFDASEDGTGRGTPLVPVAYAVRTANTSANGHGVAIEVTHTLDRANGQAVAQPVAFDTTQITSPANRSNPKAGDPCHPLVALGHAPAIAFCATDYQTGAFEQVDQSGPLTTSADRSRAAPLAVAFETVATLDARTNGGGFTGTDGSCDGHVVPTSQMRVRRLTPRECERLQGFPDDYTRIPNWNGWRALDEGETPEQLVADGMLVKQNKKSGKWRVNDPDGPRYKACGNSWSIPPVRWIGARISAEIARVTMKAAA